jgi:hypothetical protein
MTTNDATEPMVTHADTPAPYRLGRILLRITTHLVSFFTKTAVLVTVLVLALALNVATLISPVVFNALSSAVSTVSSLVTKKPVTVKVRQIDVLRDQLDQEKRLTNNIRNDLTQEKRLTEDMRHQIKKSNLDLEKANLHLKHTMKTNLDLKHAIKTTSTRISSRVAKATARNTGSIVAESMPYIGIPVVLAAATWDIKDACATMTDLRELDLAFNPEESVDEVEKTKVCGTTLPTQEEILKAIQDSPSVIWEETKELYDSMPDLPSLPSWSEVMPWVWDTLSWVNKWVSEWFQ